MMDVPSNTTDPEVFIDLDDDDREYYGDSFHNETRRLTPSAIDKRKLVVSAGLA
jgi:hypothetical protein